MKEGNKKSAQRAYHNFSPIYNEQSQILILGSFPSVKSREQEFFYGHKQNRFWKVIAAVTQNKVPVTIEEKKTLLLDNKIALWDVIESCDILGSSDASIKNVLPNDLNRILQVADIQCIYTNGNKAYEMFQKYQEPLIHRKAILLPSTSPANAACSLEQLVQKWSEINEYGKQ